MHTYKHATNGHTTYIYPYTLHGVRGTRGGGKEGMIGYQALKLKCNAFGLSLHCASDAYQCLFVLIHRPQARELSVPNDEAFMAPLPSLEQKKGCLHVLLGCALHACKLLFPCGLT